MVRELGYATTSFSPSWRSWGAMGGLFRECGDVQRDKWVQMGEECYRHGGVTLCSKLAPLLKREMISLKHPIQRPEVGFQDGSREAERE